MWVVCVRPFRLAVPKYPHRNSVSTSRSSNRTCRSPASGSRTGRHAFACNAVCSFGALFGVDRLPNLLALTTCCVGPELRPLPSTGITRLHRYYESLRHPKAPGLSLAGVRLLNRLSTPRGFPCCVRFPGVHAAATTPAQRLGFHLLVSPAVSTFPARVIGSVRASTFSRLARRSLALRHAHSRCHRIS